MQAKRVVSCRRVLSLASCLLLSALQTAHAQDATPPAGGSVGLGANGAASVSTDGAQTQQQAAATAAETPAAEAEETEQMAEAARQGEDAQQAGETLPWALAHRRFNTLSGGGGGIHLIDPSSGVPGSVRLQLGMSLMDARDFLFDGDEVQQTGQSLTASWTLSDHLELWGALQNSGTAYNEPRTLYTLGDMSLGLKFFFPVADVVSLGGDLRVKMLPDSGSMETSFGATGIGIRGALNVDLQRLPDPVPFIARLNLDYYFDNSSQVIAQTEEDHYAQLEDAAPKNDENRHLVSRFERFGLGVNRVDVFNIGVGVESPLEVGKDVYLHPMAEFQLGIPVNRQGYDCPFYSSDSTRGTRKGPDDTCLDEVGSKAWPILLTLGTRFIPPVRGLSSFLAVDIGLAGTDTFVRELSPTPPVRVHVGLGYDFDARPVPPKLVEVPIEVPAPEPPGGRVLGTVTDRASGAPIAGAQVAFATADHSALATDAEGRYISYRLPVGAVPVTVTHPEYQEGQCGTAIPESGGDVELRCELDRKVVPGSLDVRITDAYGAALAGLRVELSGPTTGSAVTDAEGRAHFADLAAGHYTLSPQSETYLRRSFAVDVREGGEHALIAPLTARPGRSGVLVRGTTIRVRGVSFDGDSAEPTAASAPVLAELADLLLGSSEIHRIQVQAPGGEGISLTRGLRIKQRLVDLGVDPGRVEALSGGGQLKVTIVTP